MVDQNGEVKVRTKLGSKYATMSHRVQAKPHLVWFINILILDHGLLALLLWASVGNSCVKDVG